MKILGHQSAIVRVVAGLAWAALGGTLFFHLWVADRGLEMTDEASYFLIALDPWHTCGHGTFHGFLLRPLYLLAGESVAGLRWLGYAIVMGASWRLAGAVRLILALEKSRLMPLCAPVLMTAALTCYSAGMRTPCYNWLILVGAMMAWSGWLRGRVSRFGPLEFGFGLMVAFWGKWGAGLILLGMFIIIGKFGEKSLAGFSRSRWAAALLTLVITSGVLAIYAGTDGIRNTLQAGIPDSADHRFPWLVLSAEVFLGNILLLLSHFPCLHLVASGHFGVLVSGTA